MKRLRSVLIAAMLMVALLGVTAGPATASTALADSDAYIVSFNYQKLGSFTAEVEALGGSVTFSHPIGLAIVSGLDGAAAGNLAAGSSAVQSVLPNTSFEIAPGHVMGEAMAVEDADLSSPTDPTSAARYAFQWNMEAVDADEAWAAGRLGSSDVTVAILDTGIDYNYPDLWGRVDLSRSVSFVPVDDAYVNFYFPGAHPIADLHYHGTHVSATVSSNAYIAAGVTSQVTLMGVKVCSVEGGCAGDAIVQGILYAVDNGADVINMSLGGDFVKSEYPGYVSVINQLFNYANRSGVTVVVSAGNSGFDLDHDGNGYKTYCSQPNTICVSATGPDGAYNGPFGPWTNIDSPAYYTNFGRSAIEVAAPGGNSGGYVWAGCSTFSLVIPFCQDAYYVIGLGGTSMAAPHVSGAAALAVEDRGRHPGQIRAILSQTADDLGQSGVDPFYGKGRLNVGAVVGQ